MADAYALDTNIYIRALRDARELACLKRFRIRMGGRLYVNAVVALELRAGATTAAHAAAVDALVAPYAARGRVIVPTFEAYRQAGRVLAALVAREGVRRADAAPSLVNDAVLAASCRERETVLVTDNARDFAAIQRHLREFKFRDSSTVF